MPKQITRNSRTDIDRIFIFHTSHGGPGFLQFGSSPALTTKMVNDTLEVMVKQKMFKQMLYLVSACHGGSIFHGQLKPDGSGK
jgi:glycosylphosphatidylinositol transamidase (GPIT) subunit GPI8